MRIEKNAVFYEENLCNGNFMLLISLIKNKKRNKISKIVLLMLVKLIMVV